MRNYAACVCILSFSERTLQISNLVQAAPHSYPLLPDGEQQHGERAN